MVLWVGSVTVVIQLLGIAVSVGLLRESLQDRDLLRAHESRRSYRLQSEDAVWCEALRLIALVILVAYRIPIMTYVLMTPMSPIRAAGLAIVDQVGPAIAAVAIVVAGLRERRSRNVIRSELEAARKRGEWS